MITGLITVNLILFVRFFIFRHNSQEKTIGNSSNQWTINKTNDNLRHINKKKTGK